MKIPKISLVACLALICALTIMSYVSEFGWLFNLCSHFHVQYVELLVGFMAIFLWRKRYLPALSAIALIAGTTGSTTHFIVSAAARSSAQQR